MDQTPPSPNLERRAKRHLWAGDHQFFAACAPGLEELCAAQLSALAAQEVDPQPGGVAFQGSLELACQANLWLRCASRVLLRLADFRVRGWSDLVRQAGRQPWEILLQPGAPLAVLVSLRSSNLNHSGQVAQVILEEAGRRMAALGLAPPVPAPPGDEAAQRVMVRGQDRRAVISLDTSGPHLHKRGYRLATGPAPLREDLAAALLIHCAYDGSQTLLDPMCGAGTLAIEAAYMACQRAPGLHRQFALENWPFDRPARWQYWRRQASQQEQTPAAPILARDLRAAAVNSCRQNTSRANLDQIISIQKYDFFTAPPPPGPPGLVVINPPYGRRLGDPAKAAELIARIGQHLRSAYPGWRCGIVLAHPDWLRLLDLPLTQLLNVPHGGLKVALARGNVPG